MRRAGLLGGVAGLLFFHGAVAAAYDGGWTYLIDKLVADGLPRETVTAAFRDRRVPAFTGLEFSPERPREPQSRYRRFLQPATVAAARRCRAQLAHAFDTAERRYGVPASVLAALLYVETACGRNTGSSVVFHRLARLAMANEPENLQRNVARLADRDGRIDPIVVEQLRTRARYLEDTFYPEVHGLFAVAERVGIDPLAVRGSPSGAFGYPQFLPTSFLRFAADGNGDGRVSLYDPHDAVASAANYLAGHGWRPGITMQERRRVIWHYNRSDAYVDTVLALAGRIAAAGGAVQAKPATRAPARRAAKAPVQKRAKSKSPG